MEKETTGRALRDPRDVTTPLSAGKDRSEPTVPKQDPPVPEPAENDPQPMTPPFRLPTDDEIKDKGKIRQS